MKRIKGYLNEIIKDNQQCIKTIDQDFSSINSEIVILKKLGIDFKLENNQIIREWIKGKTIFFWTKKKKESLKKEIELFHTLSKDELPLHDWNKYNHHGSKIDKKIFGHFQRDVLKINSAEKVVSHNDINRHNVLWNKKKIILIDFEWANLNHPYFDYVQFYISEKINLLNDYDSEVFNILLFVSLVYFWLWTFEAPQVKKVLYLRKKYIQLLRVHFSSYFDN